MAASRVQTAVGAHLVGGLAAADAETAMRTTARILGRHLHGLTDGETGVRSQWIWWQLDKLAAIDGIERAGMHGFEDADNEDYQVFPQADGGRLGDVAACALARLRRCRGGVLRVFKALREEGVIEDGVRFQVCVPTPYATVVAWVAQDDQERFFPIYADAIEAEVAEIARVVDPSELALQFDVAVEIGALTGNFAYAGDLGTKDFVKTRCATCSRGSRTASSRDRISATATTSTATSRFPRTSRCASSWPTRSPTSPRSCTCRPIARPAAIRPTSSRCAT